MIAAHWLRGRPLRAEDFPAGTPLRHFCAWNESRRDKDRRYRIAADLIALATAFDNERLGSAMALAHLTVSPVIQRRQQGRILIGLDTLGRERRKWGKVLPGPAAEKTLDRLLAAIGTADIDSHAAVFAAFEELAQALDLGALARRRPRLKRAQERPAPRRILVIRLSALGDLVQSLGPAAAIREYHRGDHVTLLTTAPFADFAGRLDYYDAVMIDPRPGRFDVAGWRALRRALRQERFDRVYDLQTSQRSAAYALLFRPGSMPEWSGIAARCSHPHANLDRDTQHTIDKQAEQLLMAGIYPTPLPALPALSTAQMPDVAGSQFVLIVPGAAAHRPAKRWPVRHYAILAVALHEAGLTPVVIGSRGEEALGAAVRDICPAAVDLVGQTDLFAVAALAQRAVLTIGNDTGVCHLAAAADCPVLVLFSSASDPAWCAPRGRRVRVLVEPDLSDLCVDSVLAEAAALLRLRLPAVADDAWSIAGGGARLTGLRF
jgi:ADP-heptose:LPS heptosyltransferase